jgi:hypothetical protein
MSGNYLCKKCEVFNSKNFGDLKKHMLKKKPCQKKNDSYLLSDDQILAISVLPNNTIIVEETLHLKNSNIMNKNKEELFNIFKSIEKKNQSSFCKFCNKEYKLNLDLKKHLVLDCFFNDLKKKENNKKFANINISNTTYNNSCYNNCIIDNSNNIYNIKVEIQPPVGFDYNWDLSKINEEKLIHLTQFMYTNLLKAVLENNKNLNVIIDNENNSGIVYKNDIEKYREMTIQDITDKTMEKLKEELIKMNKNDKLGNNIYTKMNEDEIDKRYENYLKCEDIKKNVLDHISKIYEDKKSEAITIAEKIKEIDQISNNGF